MRGAGGAETQLKHPTSWLSRSAHSKDPLQHIFGRHRLDCPRHALPRSRSQKGTLWRNRELLDIHFGEPCFATRVPCDDPSKLEDRGSTQRGLYALILRAVEEARLLIQDDPADLVLASTRLAFLLSAGLEELEEGMGRSVDALSRDNVSVDAIQVAHILMLVATVVVLALMDVLVVVPALSGHATEMRVLSCMVSDLPKDMGVEELLAECKEEAERKREGGDDVGVLDGGGEELLLREVEGEEEGEKKKGKKGKGKDQKDAGEKGDATGTRKAGT